MAYPAIRPRNVAMLFKAESTVGTDASPATSDAFPFEADGYSYSGPYTSEKSAEVNGSLAAGAPLIIGKPSEISIKCRVKGLGGSSAYSASVKPPHHALFEACGMRGLFTAAIAAEALASGTVNTGVLGASYSATAQSYRGMPLTLAGGSSGGRTAFVSNYTSGKNAALTDLFGSALSSSVTAALPGNWTYSPTTPKDVASRATDHPSGTLYIYEDGQLLKFVGCRGKISDISGEAGKPGFVTFSLTGVFAGRTTVAVPTISVPQHSAPVLAMGLGGVNPAFLLNRIEMPISSWSIDFGTDLENPDDPNTAFGFGSPEIAGRMPMLSCDPLSTHVENIDRVSEMAAGTQFSGVIRLGNTALNRVGICFPLLQVVENEPGTRGIYRTDALKFQALNSGVGPNGRDSDLTICYY